MSRKHFIKIAEAIATIEDQEERKRMAQLMADVCNESNQWFNREKFLAACNAAE